MMNYTDENFWKQYWQGYKVKRIERTFFEDLEVSFPKHAKLIEIGGFPGKIASYFKRKYNYDVAILDNYIEKKIVNQTEKINKLPINSIKCIKEDFLNSNTMDKYDIVCSFGFIEHFSDTKDIILRHFRLLKPGGILLITMPNFGGLNGALQRRFHYANYERHNIECMNLNLLKRIVSNIDLKLFKVGFIGRPALWLEKDADVSHFIRFIIRHLSKILHQAPFRNNYLLAPHIYIYAQK